MGDRTCSVGSERCSRTEESGRGCGKLVDEARDKVEKRPE